MSYKFKYAESEFNSDKLKLYFFNTIRGKSKHTELQLDEFGQINNWPDNFFGDEMTEIAETRKAAIKKRLNNMKETNDE